MSGELINGSYNASLPRSDETSLPRSDETSLPRPLCQGPNRGTKKTPI